MAIVLLFNCFLTFFEAYLTDCNKNDEEPLVLDDFLSLRADSEKHGIFVSYFVKAIVGLSEWSNQLLDPKFPPANLFTASDEAFALAALENNYDRCLNLYQDAGNEAPKPKRNKENPKTEFYSNVPTKFTGGGIKYTDQTVKANTSRGWTETGILKFNHYYEKMKAN